MKIRLEFKLEDMWIGIFWRTSEIKSPSIDKEILDIWICLIPCFPIHITKERLRRYDDDFR